MENENLFFCMHITEDLQKQMERITVIHVNNHNRLALTLMRLL